MAQSLIPFPSTNHSNDPTSRRWIAFRVIHKAGGRAWAVWTLSPTSCIRRPAHTCTTCSVLPGPPTLLPGQVSRSRAVRVKEVEEAPRLIDEPGAESLLEAIANRRDRFLVALMVETGVRIGEALGLRTEDLHLFHDSRTVGCAAVGAAHPYSAATESQRRAVQVLESENGPGHRSGLHSVLPVP